MKKIFSEYQQFTENEYKELWKNCIFVLDTNILLNMYKYSRETVKEYFEILNTLKNKNQLWIPYQVGYEFFENRLNVISSTKKSYDEILNIIDNTKKQIESNYQNHPFLNLQNIKNQIDTGLKKVITYIKDEQNKHPSWLHDDEVLKKINEIFDGNVGMAFSEEELQEIKKEGEERYKKLIPPGFKDNKKPDDKKYGDLILWKQILQKAKEKKQPIILISGDIKEDWWLEKDGERIMPLPQLKKEIRDFANVDFHIYTAVKFIEYYNKNFNFKQMNSTAINEVRNIQELEEENIKLNNIRHKENQTKRYTDLKFSSIVKIITLLDDIRTMQFPKRFHQKIIQLTDEVGEDILQEKETDIIVSHLKDLSDYIEASKYDNPNISDNQFNIWTNTYLRLRQLIKNSQDE